MVELVSIHSRGVAGFIVGPDHQGVAIKGDAVPEPIISTCVGGLDVVGLHAEALAGDDHVVFSDALPIFSGHSDQDRGHGCRHVDHRRGSSRGHHQSIHSDGGAPVGSKRGQGHRAMHKHLLGADQIGVGVRTERRIQGPRRDAQVRQVGVRGEGAGSRSSASAAGGEGQQEGRDCQEL